MKKGRRAYFPLDKDYDSRRSRHDRTGGDRSTDEDPELTPLLSDEPTIELVVRARAGDRPAMEALLERCLPPLKRWAHGRLPAAARGNMDTGDLVQEAALHVLGAWTASSRAMSAPCRRICASR